MTRRSWTVAIATAGLFALALGVRAQIDGTTPDPANASVPELIPYRGYVEQNGVPVVDPVQMTFYLVTDPNQGVGQALWQETQAVQPVNGNFAVSLGAVAPFKDVPGERLFERHALYLGIQIAGVDLQNKQRLLAAPYAMTARQAQHMTVDGNLAVAGNAALTSFTVSGGATFNGGIAIAAGTLSSPNGASLGATTVAGGLNVSSGGARVSGGLDVTGGNPVANTVSAGAVSTGALTVTNGLPISLSQHYTADGSVNPVDLGPMARSACFVTGYGIVDNTGSTSASNQECYVSDNGTNFLGFRTGTGGDWCSFRCIRW